MWRRRVAWREGVVEEGWSLHIYGVAFGVSRARGEVDNLVTCWTFGLAISSSGIILVERHVLTRYTDCLVNQP